MRGLGRRSSAPSSSSGSRSGSRSTPRDPRDGAPRLTIPDVISSAQNSGQNRSPQNQDPRGGEGGGGGQQQQGRSSRSHRNSSANCSARVAMVTQGWASGAVGGREPGARSSSTAPARSLAGMKVCIQQNCSNRGNTLNGVFPSTSGGGGSSRQHVEIRCSPQLPQCRGHPLAATNRPLLDNNNANAIPVSPPVVPVAPVAPIVAPAPAPAPAPAANAGARTPEALPDILNSHVPPTSPAPPPYPQRPNQHRHPLRAASVPAQNDLPRRGTSRNRSSSSSLAWFGRLSASPVTTLDSSTSLGHNHSTGGVGSLLASLQNKQCCTGTAVRSCLTLITTFRWVLVALALLGVGCVITGIVLGALHMSMGSSFLTLSLMFIGKSQYLSTVFFCAEILLTLKVLNS